MIFTVTPSGLVPQSEYWEEYEKFPMGEDVTAEPKQPRNLGNHRRFFAFLKVVYDMQEVYTNMEDLRVELKLKTGHYTEHITTKGKLIYVPKSMDFSNMDDIKFKDFFSKCIDVALDSFCPSGMGKEHLKGCIDAVLQFG